MRFSAVVVAAVASNAAALGTYRQEGSWARWGNFGGNWGKGGGQVSTITVPVQPTAVPVSTAPSDPAVVPTPVADAPTAATTPAAAAAVTPAASASGSLDADQQKALDAHNAARADVGVPPLVWDAGLASDAQEWATHLTSVGSLTHSQTSGEGENLYMQSGSGAGATPNLNAANAWLAEKSQYNGEAISSTNYMGFGHYTQAVWKTTTKVGMAIATDSKGATYVVARYSPPGNYIGEKPY